MGDKVKVFKIDESENYGNMFVVELPVKFFFNKDGSFDGIEVHVEHASEHEKILVTELCDKLAQTLKIKYTYSEEEEGNAT